MASVTDGAGRNNPVSFRRQPLAHTCTAYLTLTIVAVALLPGSNIGQQVRSAKSVGSD